MTDVKYLKISPSGQARLWPECRDGGFIAVAWDEIGDIGGLTRREFEVRMAEVLPHHSDWSPTKLWQVWEVSRLHAGDKVLANEGISRVLGFGTVTGPYYYDEDAPDHRHRVPIDWYDTVPRRINQGGWRRTVIKLREEQWKTLEAAPALDAELAEPSELSEASEIVEDRDENGGAPSIPRNVILYGPPGTGKTFVTTRRAVEMCLSPDETLDDATYADEFRELRQAGQIEFVTFHQSYGYEEFVEGIRPTMDADGESEVLYKHEAGIFKRIARRAAAEGVKSQPAEPPFETLWSDLLANVAQAEEDGTPMVVRAPRGRRYALSVTAQENLRAYNLGRTGEDESEHQHKYLHALKRYSQALWNRRRELGTALQDYSYQIVSGAVASELGTGGGCHGNVQWVIHLKLLALAEERRGIDPTPLDATDRIALLREYLRDGRTHELNYDDVPQYVLIVDEINRGNISKILGELITLLEPSKRLTMPDELVLQLPYTKEQFGVPPNLHIIGTMNTADRSIALMDVALRRRFEFQEMMPDSKVVLRALTSKVVESVTGGKSDFINLVVALFECLNARIRFLYDDEHQLGHSYFMTATSYEDLRETLLSRVIPMLQEYFYGSWDRVCATLGCPYNEAGQPARGGNRAPFIRATLVQEHDLLGFHHGDFDDAVTFQINDELLHDRSPERLRQMCIDALSGPFLAAYESRAYTS